MSWNKTLQIEIAETFVEEASGYSSEQEFVFALYQELMISRRKEQAKERSQRRRDILSSQKGFWVEEVVCRGCGKVFGRTIGVRGRPRVYCRTTCQSRVMTRRWRGCKQEGEQ